MFNAKYLQVNHTHTHTHTCTLTHKIYPTEQMLFNSKINMQHHKRNMLSH